jgi:hypothetical protein
VSARILILIAFCAAVAAKADTIISQSQQFVVHYMPVATPLSKIPEGAVEVVPQFLVVTAERVKDAVVAELPALRDGRRQIHLIVQNSAGRETPIAIGAAGFADTWRYEVAVPRLVDEAHLVKAFIDVLLLEYANRGASRNAELPVWLTDGMAEQLLHSIGPKLVVTRRPNAWEASTSDINLWTRETLRTNSAPTFQELTMSSRPAEKSPEEGAYLAGTHLLVHSLLQMPNGRQRLANFLQLLPRVWNWQTAFMQAFDFPRMLDVEKWWALTVIEFTSRDERQAWSMDASLRKLDELLKARVEYRGATNELPELRFVDLPTVIKESDASLQRQELMEIVTQLGYTVPHMAPAVAAQALSYKQTLEAYLQKRDGNGVSPRLRSTPEALRQSLVDDTLRRVTALDQQRRALAEKSVTAR